MWSIWSISDTLPNYFSGFNPKITKLNSAEFGKKIILGYIFCNMLFLKSNYTITETKICKITQFALLCVCAKFNSFEALH